MSEHPSVSGALDDGSASGAIGGEKTYPHVPPRIDPDLYQADVPDWEPREAAEQQATGARVAYSGAKNDSPAVRDFLTIVRNLLGTIHPRGHSNWAAEQTLQPLESDSFALEYLSTYDYNVEKALFSLYCEMGRGKDAIISGRAVSISDRTASNVIFSDCKERIFRAPPQPALGFYPSMHNGSGHSHINSHRAPSLNGSTLDEAGLGSLSAAIITGVSENGSTEPARAVFTEIVRWPRALSAEGALFSAGAAGGEEGGDVTAQSPEEGAPAARTSKPRVATADKLELRRKWLGVAQRAFQLLGPSALSSGGGSAASSAGSVGGVRGSAGGGGKRGALSEAQAVLDAAYSLPPYVVPTSGAGSGVLNSSSAANLSTAAVAAATEEAFLLDNLNMLLGKLVKAVLACRFLVSEVRDAIYSCSIDAVILTHPTEVRRKGGSKKGHAESLVKGLHELLREMEVQPLAAETEERQLREVTAATEALLRQTRTVLRECCAWEASALTDPTAVGGSISDDTTAEQALRGPRGRPEAYSAAQVKALLRQHVQLHLADGQTFAAAPFAKRPAMSEVGELLRSAALNPVKISEVTYLESLHAQGQRQVDLASTILMRSAQLAEAKTRLTLDRVRYSLPEVQALLVKMHTFPFRSQEVDALQALVTRAETWRSAVAAIKSSGGEGATEVAASRPSRKSEAASAQSKPIPLKRVEALIAEGERYPFELGPELEVLRDKRQQAKAWLEKLKRSFVPTKVGSSRGRKGGEDSAGAAAVAEKLSLADMKMMVSEGASLYQEPEDEEQGEGAAILPTGGRLAGIVSSRTATRELDRAQAVVESAEDWISRVRELLCGEEDHGGAEDGDGEGDADHDGDMLEEPETPEEATERTIQALRSMLDEADSMPVSLEECGLLRLHLQALEWAARVRPLLNRVAEDPRDAEPSESTDAAAGTGKPARRAKDKAGLPRLNEMQQHAKEITRIRSSMNALASSDFPLKPLAEETACLNIVSDAERWLGRVKKLMQGTSVRKGTRLARLVALCEEGTAIPIHLEAELRPMRAAIASAEAWRATYSELLTQLKIADSADSADGDGERMISVDPVPEAPVDSTAVAAIAAVPLPQLVEASAAAAQLAAEFDSAREVQELVQRVERWLHRVSKLCGISPVLVEVPTQAAPESVEAAGAEAASGRPGKRRKVAPDGSSTTADSTATAAAEDGEGTGAVDNSGTVNVAATTAPISMVTPAQLDDLVSEGRSFGVDLEDRVALLLALKSKADAWDREATAYVSTHFAEAFKRAFVDYKRLLTDYAASDHGALFSFLANRKPSALTPGNQAKAVKEESTLYGRLQALLSEILEVRARAEAIGVETPFYHGILVYVRLLEWVQETRSATCSQTALRRPAALPPLPAKASSKLPHTSFGGWEDLRDPVRLKNWGDFNEDLVLSLIQEGALMLSQLYALETDEKLPGMLAHYSKGVLAPAAEYQEPVEASDEPEDGMAEDEQRCEESGEDGVGGSEEEGGDAEPRSAGKKRQLQSGDVAGSSRKKRAVVAQSSVAATAATDSPHLAGTKSTRAAFGITKRKVDEDFAETVNLNQLGQPAAAQAGADGAASAKSKRASQQAHASAASIVKTEPSSEAAAVTIPEPPVPLDLQRTAHRAGLQKFLASPHSQAARLAPAMAYMVDLWMRALKVFAMRLRTASRWVGDAQRLLQGLGATLDVPEGSGAEQTSTLGSAKSGTGAEIERLLEVAQQESIQSKHRILLESTVQESKDWLKRAAAMRTSSAALLTMDELKAFLKAGEKVIYVHERNTELQELRGELKRARQWKARLEKSGFEVGTAAAEVLSELVDEARTIRVNLSEFTDSIVQVNKMYCLCRQAYHGEMVGCDTCEDWYHFQCVGLSVSQAEKCAKYVCIRCSLKNSFLQAANTVAQLTNKWMNCVEHFRRRDETFQKVSKKLYKDEKELIKARANLKTLMDAAPPGFFGSAPAPAVAASGDADAAGSANPAADANAAETATSSGTETVLPVAANGLPFTPVDAEKLLTAKREMDQLQLAVAKCAQEKEKLKEAITVETQLHKEVFRWMQAMQELLWPFTEEQVALGMPVGPSEAAPLRTTSVSEYTSALLGQLHMLLPVGLRHMERAAALVGILTLEDVALVLDAFRWMGWSNLCLHLLRFPPTTPVLRRMLDATRNLRYTDEKVIKLLQGVLQRATAWKAKARKMLSPPYKKLDLAKLQALALEGNTIVLTSRVKEKLREVISGHVAPSAQEASSEDAAAAGLGKGAKRGVKTATEPSGAPPTAAASWSGETWGTLIRASGVEDCASSDEEDLQEKIDLARASGAELAAPQLRPPFAQKYGQMNGGAMAEPPLALWPPQLLVARRRPAASLAISATTAAGAATTTPGTVATGAPAGPATGDSAAASTTAQECKT